MMRRKMKISTYLSLKVFSPRSWSTGLVYFPFPSECIRMRVRVCVFFSVRVSRKRLAGTSVVFVRDSVGAAAPSNHVNLAPYNRLAWSQRYAQENLPGRGAEPGSLRVDGDRHSRTLRLSTQTSTLKLDVSLSHSVPFSFFLWALVQNV